MNKLNWRKIVVIDVVILLVLVGGWWAWTLTSSNGEAWLALVTYTGEAEDGVAIVNVNPNSGDFGQVIQNFPLGAGVAPHHLYFSPDGQQLFTTALAGEELYVLELSDNRLSGFEPVDVGTCALGENLWFSDDNRRIYLTCMGSDEIVVLNRATLQRQHSIRSTIDIDPAAYVRYPHGIAVNAAMDRMLVTETVSADLSDAGSRISVIEYSTGEVLASHLLQKADGQPSGPVEVVFSQSHPVAYISGMLDASLWTAQWDDADADFEFSLADDTAARGHTWPLEMYPGPGGHLYVSFAQPGVVDVYGLDDPGRPQYLRTLPADAGAHHLLFTSDGKYMLSQNNLLGLDGMNAGTITVVDLNSDSLAGRFEMLKNTGLMPTSMVWLGQP